MRGNFPRRHRWLPIHATSPRVLCFAGSLALGVGLLGIVLLGSPPASAQNPLLDAIELGEPTEEPSEGAGDRAAEEIARALSAARERLEALEGTRDSAEAPSPSASAIDLATRLVRVLEQRRDAQGQIDALRMGRGAIESGLARDPSEIVADPPPFPIPTLDGVLAAYRNAARHEEEHRGVLEDHEANLQLARETREDLEKERRRLRDVLAGEGSEVERIRLETELRGLEDRLAIERQLEALAAQRVEISTIDHEIRVSATRQTKAALVWVESQLAPREADLTDAIERLDRERIELDRALELAKSRLASAESTLRATEERRAQASEVESPAQTAEVATRRAQFGHHQQIVALLTDRIERIERRRTAWRHRYATLGENFDPENAPAWRSEAESELERLTRVRRIRETELAEARRALTALVRRAATATTASSRAKRLFALEREDLEELVSLYESDLETLDSAIELEERLRVELLARMSKRDLGERVESALAATTSFWNYELTTSEDSPITPGKIVIALTVFFVGLWLAGVARNQLRVRVFPRFGFDRGASSAFASLTFYALLAVAFLLALRAVNIPLTAFAVAGGALAIGIGFGSQTVISNFISGLLLLAERPIRTGDLVEISGVIGTVESIGLRSTRIRTPDNFHIIVPNASFLESNVVNWTHEDPMLRLRVKVGVAYGSPTTRVAELLVQAAQEHPRTRPSPEPAAVFSDFGDSALLFEVRFWIRYDEQTDRTAIQSDVRFRIDELLAENDIVIAFPQMDVHLDVTDRA